MTACVHNQYIDFDELKRVLWRYHSDMLAMCVFDCLVYFQAPCEFNRASVFAQFYRIYTRRIIDHALSVMESHGICECVRNPTGGKHGGAVYRVKPRYEWHDFDISVVERRRARYLRRLEPNTTVVAA